MLWTGENKLPKYLFTKMFLYQLFLLDSKSQLFFPIWALIILMCLIWETSRNKLKNILFQKSVWPFTVQIKCSSDLKNFWNSRLKAENLQKFWDHKNNLFICTVKGKYNFWSECFLTCSWRFLRSNTLEQF